MYRRELDADPAAGLYGPYVPVLSVDAAEDDLLTVVRWRVVAAGRSWRHFVMIDDLRVVRDRLIGRHETEWLGLLVMATDWAAWGQPWEADDNLLSEANAYLRAELAAVRHLGIHHGHFFDRIEETEYVAAAARQRDLTLMPDELLAVVRSAWAGRGEVRPSEIASGVADVAADPKRYLGRFDMVIQAKGPGLIVLVVQALERHRAVNGPGDEPEFPPDHVRALARRIDVGRDDGEYARVRTAVLNLLLAEAVHPTEFATACGEDPLRRYRYLGEAVESDLSLRAVWLAVRLYAG